MVKQLNFRKQSSTKVEVNSVQIKKEPFKTTKANDFMKSIPKPRVKTSKPFSNRIASTLITSETDNERRETMRELEQFQLRLSQARFTSVID